VSEPRIDERHYDSSGYFEGQGARHLADPESRFQRYRVAKVVELAGPRPADRVVDLGCGWGTFCFALAGRVAEIVGVDFSRRAIDLCEQRLRGAPAPNVSFLCADAGATGLAGEAFDLVIAADLFEHLYPDDSARVAREAFRVLAAGGRFATWTPHRGHLLEVLKNHDLVLKRDVTHVDYKSMADMKRLLSDAGFTIERAYYAESHVPGLRVAERWLGPVVPLLRRRIAVLGRKPDVRSKDG
jgi:cyclopropane fatty-acyl-phospholipid synthase-like methyltransferase